MYGESESREKVDGPDASLKSPVLELLSDPPLSDPRISHNISFLNL